MPKVYNWQLGREVEYIYEGAKPKRQFSVVMNLNKCIACQTCTMACKTTWSSGRGQEYMLWNNVETKPHGFYPLGWDVHLMEEFEKASVEQKWENGIYRGKTIIEAAPSGERMIGWLPEDLDWANPNIGEDETTEPVDIGTVIDKFPNPIWMFYLPRICNHCSYPACLAACPRKAIYKRQEDGIVLIDPERCEGYQECVRACPYKKSMFNQVVGISQKCIGCFPKIEQGLMPQCVTTCIGKIRIMGFINEPDKIVEDNPIDFLVHVKKVALPLYPQTGMQPNVYYIPPTTVPIKYLRQMFGPGADHAVETYKRMREGKEPELQALLILFGCTEFIPHKFKVDKDFVMAFDEKGNELVRVPLTEPIVMRPEIDLKLGVTRQDIS
ncbi:MAG: 4Fe-4S dicluster domain-containing protein [Thermoproteota archaeon]